MEIVNRIPRMQAISRRLRKEGKKIGFVPTMGALHEGHLSLISRARTMSDVVVVSIFVNPIQFGKGEDFDKYPRDLAKDAELVTDRGVDYLFAPNRDEVYPKDYSTYVLVEDLSDKLCGLSRPGHFRGVTTVVMKLLNIVRPNFCFFGQKDGQQAVIIKRMIRDLCVDTEMVVCPIVRDSDGLALSSRNIYLNKEERSAATVLFRALNKGKQLFEEGETEAARIIAAMQQVIEAEPLARIDYVALVDPETLEDVYVLEEDRKVMAAVAVYIGSTRLIDNMIFGEKPTFTYSEEDL
ncbi:MAG: pantoate--beta-alanine ligase [Acidobacteriota bacterium]|nr:pantoate--beta-alanine ligase [Blastocatellia bacterium]MDW8412451.1 pantoate--beta-alanine ligase [Acidobacteriota bacterium]